MPTILRRRSKARLWPGDVLTVASPTPSGSVLRVKVFYVGGDRVWGRECNGTGGVFGPFLALPGNAARAAVGPGGPQG
jgi:hypothetical protein